MAGICFYFEPQDVDVWSGKKLDAWHYACSAAGDIDEIVVINKNCPSPGSPGAQYKFREVYSLEEANLRGVTAQVVCPWEAREDAFSLWDFDHDVDWYVFGPASGWLGKNFGDDQVFLPMSGGGALHSVHIASAVLLHRFGALS